MSTCRSLEDILEEVRNRGFDETDVDAIDEIGKLLENVEIEKMPIETYRDIAELADAREYIKPKDSINRTLRKPKLDETIGVYSVTKLDNGKYILDYLTTRKALRRVATIPADGITKEAIYKVEDLEKLAAKKVDMLGSSEDIKFNKKVNVKGMAKYALDLHKDLSKATELLDLINELDDKKASEEDMKAFKEMFSQLKPEFFKEMHLYINDKAAKTGGVITSSKIVVHIAKVKSAARNAQSAAEAYAHEISHAFTWFGLKVAKNDSSNIKARRILRKLEKIMKRAKEVIKGPEQLFGGNWEEATEEEKKIATDMYNYIFTSDVAEEEFISHALTNPTVRKVLKTILMKDVDEDTSLLHRTAKWFAELMDYVMNGFSFKDNKKDLFELTSELAMHLAEHNSEAIRKTEAKRNVVNALYDHLDTLDEKVADKISEWAYNLNKKLDKAYNSKPTTRTEKLKAAATEIGKALLDKNTREMVMTYLDQLGFLDARSSVASAIRDFSEGDNLSKTIDFLQLQAGRIDSHRKSMMTIVTTSVKEAFKAKLTNKLDSALTSVILDTSVNRIFGSLRNDEKENINRWVTILNDEEQLDKEIAGAKVKLKELDKQHYNWHVNQAVGLGYFMATGEGHLAQNLNTYDIARGVLSTTRKRPYIHKAGDLQRALDKVAALTALKYTDVKEKKEVAKLLAKDTKGVEFIVDVQNRLEKEARETLFKDSEGLMMQGYTKELFDDQITIEIDLLKNKEEMESKGFTLVKELEKHPLIRSQEKFGLYKSTNFNVSEYHRSAVQLTKLHTKGTSIKDLIYNGEEEFEYKKFLISKNRLDTERYKIIKQMTDGTFDATSIDKGLVPLVNSDGDVVDYRYIMPKKAKKDLLNQNTKASDVLGATKGSVYGRQVTKEHNAKILDVIKKDMEENFNGSTFGEDGKSFIIISEFSEDPEIRELWKILPREFKEEAYRNEGKQLAVRKELFHNYFGYRIPSITNFPWLKDHMPRLLKTFIRIAEIMWQEFIKILKVDILIKMPFILVQNIISNVLYAINTHSSPGEILGLYKESFKDVREYLTKHRELLRLEELVAIGAAKESAKDRILILKKELERNPIHELYTLGMYQVIVENIEQEELNDTNILKRKYKEKIDSLGVPKIVKDGINWLYLTEETQYYKIMTEVLQMSDLVARDVQNRKLKKVLSQVDGKKVKLPWWYINHLKEEKSGYGMELHLMYGSKRTRDNGMSKEEKAYFDKVAEEYRHNVVLNDFINYNKVSGPGEEYLNKMGFIMFTKYAKRIQRVVANLGGRYPIRTLLMGLLTDGVTDIDTVLDQQLLVRSWYNMTPQNPLDRVLEVMTPASVQLVTGVRF